MILWHKVRTVASFEFRSTVSRKGYLITTFGMPLFVMLYGLLISTIGFFVVDSESKVKVYGVVDGSAVLQLEGDVQSAGVEIPEEVRSALESSGQAAILDTALGFADNRVFRPFDNEEQAKAALMDDTIEGFFVLLGDYLDTGRVQEYYGEGIGLSNSDARGALKDLLLERLLAGRLEPHIAERVTDPIAERDSWTVTRAGDVEERSGMATLAQLIVPLIFTVLLFVSLMMSASYLVQGTAIEKENKVVEVLLSSANPDEVLTGKLLGLGGAGLLQVSVWFGMMIFGGFAFAAALAKLGVEIPWMAMGVGLAFFVTGYLFMGSGMLGLGSLGNNMRESQQLTMLWTMLAVVPMMFMGLFIADPHSLPALIMTWIPFTAPITVILRLTLGPEGIAWWEIAGSLAVLVASTWFALRFGARLFRIGLLLTGSRPKLREIFRQARLS